MDPITAGVIGTAANTAGGMGSTMLQNRYNKKAYERQRADMKADQYEMQAYNHPKQQIHRLQEAGLNPALMYKQGDTGQTVMPGKADLNPAQAPDMSKIGSQFLENKMAAQTQNNLALQAENIRMQKQAMESQIAVNQAQITKMMAETDWRKVNTQQMTEKFPYIINTLAQNLKIGESGLQTAELNRENIKSQINERAERIKQIKASTKFTLDSNERAEAELALKKKMNEEQIKEIAQRILKSEADKKYVEAQTETNAEQKKKLMYEANLLETEYNTIGSSKTAATAANWLKIILGK